jgi:hypothetical protein
MYAQMDSMQEAIQQLEDERTQTNSFLKDTQKLLADSQPKLMEAEFQK